MMPSDWHEPCMSLCRSCGQPRTFSAWRVKVKSKNRNWMPTLFAYACAVVLLANPAVAANGDKARQLSQGESAKISGLILSRDGDLMRVHEKKSGEVVVVRI